MAGADCKVKVRKAFYLPLTSYIFASCLQGFGDGLTTMKSPLCLLFFFFAASLDTSSCFAGDASGSASTEQEAPVATQAAAATQSVSGPMDTPSGKATIPLSPPSASTVADISFSVKTTIPGPLRSFLRMAGISQKASNDEVLPLLAQEVDKRGYVEGKPTEFLILLKRYMQQARELVVLAGPQAVIHVSNCEEARPLLTILGYRVRQGCGADATVQTEDAGRAFLTIDSGFPLVELEETLRGGKPFTLPYPSSPVPVLFTPNEWTGSDVQDVADSLLRDPALARLYSALGQMDAETAASLRQAPGLRRLVRFSNVLNFYGSHIYIRSGRVAVPGGASAEAAWKDLVGAGPESPADFVGRLIAKDEGWLAAYYDALSRVSQSQQAYFTEPGRLKRFYEALRGQQIVPSPAKPVFRPDPGFSLLVTRLQLDANGQPHIPGDLESWKAIFRHNGGSKRSREWARRASHWNDPEQLVEGFVALSRDFAKDGQLQIYLMLDKIDRGRSADQRLTPQTVRLLADKFSRYGDQYIIFAEFHGLDNTSIAKFITAAEILDRISLATVRANAIGIFQANLGLWQILARQGQISDANLNDSWQHTIGTFTGINSSALLFDAGRASLKELLRSVTGSPEVSQNEIITLLSGPTQTEASSQQVQQELATRIRTVLDAQRLVSLDTLFTLGDG